MLAASPSHSTVQAVTSRISRKTSGVITRDFNCSAKDSDDRERGSDIN